MNPVVRARRLWRLTAKKPPELRLRYVRSVVDRRAGRAVAVLALRRLTGRQASELLAYLRELRPDEGLLAHLADAYQEYLRISARRASGTLLPAESSFLYAAVRALRPGVVVETGTANGVSSSFVLEALRRNGAGRLLSIDLPFVEAGVDEVAPLVPGSEIGYWDVTPLPPGKEPGCGPVGAAARPREELLPEALAELGAIDVFFHDSLHTREHMLFEFHKAWPRLRPGGLLLADDVFQGNHDALPAFARSVGRPWGNFAYLGYVRKPA